jgi:2-(1,2-epoxy-1,2-dihydrophenyl)acetyl-CoA isomerase
MSELTTIRWERQGPVGVLTLARPESRNGIVRAMMLELHALLASLVDDASLGVLLLQGEGGDFCPGADLRASADGKAGGTPIETFDVATLLHDMPAVTIAAIRGACAGAGLAWAAACDLRIASSSARFNTAFLDVGLCGDMGGPWTLPRIVGAAVARDLYFLPGKFDAAEALRIGLVSRVIDDGDFATEAHALAHRVAAKAPRALRTIKENFVAAERMGFGGFVTFEAERHNNLARGAESREARAAFLEKRAPVFERA